SGWQRAPVHSRPTRDRLSICKGIQIACASIEMERLRLTTAPHPFLLSVSAAGLLHLRHRLLAAAAVVAFPIPSAVHSHRKKQILIAGSVFERGRTSHVGSNRFVSGTAWFRIMAFSAKYLCKNAFHRHNSV